MVTRYPHSVTIGWTAESTLNPSTGEWTAGAPLSITSECRCIPAGDGKKVMGDDGNMTEYGFEVVMPKQTQVAPFGATVTMTFDGNQVQGSLKRMFNYQLSTKLWV